MRLILAVTVAGLVAIQVAPVATVVGATAYVVGGWVWGFFAPAK